MCVNDYYLERHFGGYSSHDGEGRDTIGVVMLRREVAGRASVPSEVHINVSMTAL